MARRRRRDSVIFSSFDVYRDEDVYEGSTTVSARVPLFVKHRMEEMSANDSSLNWSDEIRTFLLQRTGVIRSKEGISSLISRAVEERNIGGLWTIYLLLTVRDMAIQGVKIDFGENIALMLEGSDIIDARRMYMDLSDELDLSLLNSMDHQTLRLLFREFYSDRKGFMASMLLESHIRQKIESDPFLKEFLPMLQSMPAMGDWSVEELEFLLRAYFGFDRDVGEYVERLKRSSLFLIYHRNKVLGSRMDHRERRGRLFFEIEDDMEEPVSVDVEMLHIHPMAQRVLKEYRAPVEDISKEVVYGVVSRYPLASVILMRTLNPPMETSLEFPDEDLPESILIKRYYMRRERSSAPMEEPYEHMMEDESFEDTVHELVGRQILMVKRSPEGHLSFYITPRAKRAVREWWIEQS